MGRLAVINGKTLPPDEAVVSVYDRGFLYGDTVFETLRTYGGKLYALDEHVRRLEHSAHELAIQLPIERDVLARETSDAVSAAGNVDSHCRIILSRGSGPVGLDPSAAAKPMRVILVEPLPPLDSVLYEEGIAAICVQTIRASDAAHSAKLGNYVASVLALRDAKAAGAREALVVNRDGMVVEGTTANLFAVREGELVTPPLDAGVLAGITRSVVIEVALAQGLNVRYAAYSPEALIDSEELFLTSSIRELVPVVRVDGHTIAAGMPGKITQMLHAAFRRRVGA